MVVQGSWVSEMENMIWIVNCGHRIVKIIWKTTLKGINYLIFTLHFQAHNPHWLCTSNLHNREYLDLQRSKLYSYTKMKLFGCVVVSEILNL